MHLPEALVVVLVGPPLGVLGLEVAQFSPPTLELEAVLITAYSYADRRSHSELQPEHVLATALHDDDLAQRFADSGFPPADVIGQMEARLEALPRERKGAVVPLSPALTQLVVAAQREHGRHYIPPTIHALWNLLSPLFPQYPLREPADVAPASRGATSASGAYRATRPRLHVVLRDDPKTKANLVVDMLVECFGSSELRALHSMKLVDIRGAADLGELAADEATDLAARANAYLTARGSRPLITTETDFRKPVPSWGARARRRARYARFYLKARLHWRRR